MKRAFAILILCPVLAIASWRINSSNSSGLVITWQQGNVCSEVVAAASAPTVYQAPSAVIGLPAGSTPQITYKILSDVTCPSYPQGLKTLPAVHLGTPGRYRDLDIVALELNIFQQVAGAYTTISAMEIKVTFNAGPGSGRQTFPQPVSHPCEIFLQQWLINYSQSRAFRYHDDAFSTRKVTSLRQAQNSLPGTRLIVKTNSEKIYVLTYDELTRAGVPLKNIDPRIMKLYHLGRQMPIYIQGENDGRWDKGDYIEFIGMRPQGTLLPEGGRSYNSLYTNYAVSYLVWGTAGYGVRAPLAPIFGPAGGVIFSQDKLLPPQALFHRVKVHAENDNMVIRLGGVAIADVLDLGSVIDAKELGDFWAWVNQGINPDAVNVNFSLPYEPYTDNTSAFTDSMRVTVRMQGITDILTAPYDHHVKFLLNSKDISQTGGVNNTARWAGTGDYIWHSGPIIQGPLKADSNILTIQKINDLTTTQGEFIKFQDAFLDYIEVEYTAGFQAVNDELRFSNNFPDSTGEHLFVINDLTPADYTLWDIDGRKLNGFNLTRTGLKLQLSFSDSVSSLTTYYLAADSRRLSPEIYLDTLPDLLSPSNRADYIIITVKSLLGRGLDSLVTYRASQGLAVKVVQARHIYQAFGDGSMDPASIRDFVSYAYNNWSRPGPSYILLLGDASVMYDKVSGWWGHNLVPTKLIHIPGWGVTSSDEYFVKVSGQDAISDLFIGRIPASNSTAVSSMVSKIIAHESRAPGAWKNKLLLLGGYENIFTQTNDMLQSMATEGGLQHSRLDMYESSPYYRKPESAPSAVSLLDSAFNLVSFVGHGGGSVWSDAGVLTLEDLKSFSGPHAIPFIYSGTCLTGYYEDAERASLGEEMLRLNRGGAVSFYGASGYISSLAGQKLAAELLTAVLGSGSWTVGALVQKAEASVALKTGPVFLPILGEFDLLGDPALRLNLPPAEGVLNLAESYTSGQLVINVQGASDRVTSGQGIMTAYLRDSAVKTQEFTVSDGSYQERITLDFPESDLNLYSSGRVTVFYWDDTTCGVSSGIFTALNWLIDSVFVNPALPQALSTAQVGFNMERVREVINFNGGSILYAVADEEPQTFPREVLINRQGDRAFVSATNLSLQPDAGGLVEPWLFFKLRLSLTAKRAQGDTITIPDIGSRVYKFRLQVPPDLAFQDPAFTVPVQNDLGVWVHFINRGLGADSGFQLVLDVSPGLPVSRSDTLGYTGQLGPNASDSIFFPLTETDYLSPLRVNIIPSLSGMELKVDNNSGDISPAYVTSFLDDPGDTLFLKDTTCFIHYISGTGARIFARSLGVPAGLPEHLGYVLFGQDTAGSWEIKSADKDLKFSLVQAGRVVLAKGNVAQPGWHYQLEGAGNWLMLDTAQFFDSTRIQIKFFMDGVYGLFYNSDVASPRVELTARGRLLLQEDYVPINTPLQLILRDNAGIDFLLRKPSVLNFGGHLDSMTLVSNVSGGAAKTGIIQFTPNTSQKRDSVEVVVYDVSGNFSRVPFTWKMGDDFNIKLLGGFPNPFADTVIIAYQVTDFAEKVTLKIYSRAGRLVNKLHDDGVVGYREKAWDGRSSGGADIANGLYYVKISAESGDQSVSRVLKLFKMKRR